MPRNVPLTPDQVRETMRLAGVTLTQWAEQRGYRREAVYRVLSGRDKAHYGQAHDIAVALGLKCPLGQSIGSLSVRNLQSQRVA
jgi:gp16 family phage-associated protein